MIEEKRWKQLNRYFDDIQDEEYQALLEHKFYPTVMFDVDSCIVGAEGIIELGKIHGKTEEVTDLTNRAMDGLTPLNDVFALRLNLIQPKIQDLKTVSDIYLTRMIEDAVKVFQTLQAVGVDIHLLSGGFDAAIYPLAKLLGVSQKNVHANTLIFDVDGNYTDFDRKNPLVQQGRVARS